jgi:adenosine deaminase
MIDQGLNVGINSDDPAYFGGYMNSNFIKAAIDSNLSKEEMINISRNSIEASFATTEEKFAMLTELV